MSDDAADKSSIDLADVHQSRKSHAILVSITTSDQVSHHCTFARISNHPVALTIYILQALSDGPGPYLPPLKVCCVIRKCKALALLATHMQCMLGIPSYPSRPPPLSWQTEFRL